MAAWGAAAAPVTEARVSIRFQRLGRKKKPFYRIVAMESKKARNAAYLAVSAPSPSPPPSPPCPPRLPHLAGPNAPEAFPAREGGMGHVADRALHLSSQQLGWYNPMTKETYINAQETQKWLENGAQPSDTVHSLLKRALPNLVVSGKE